MTAEEATLAVQVRFMGDLPAVVGRRKLQVDLPEGCTVSDLLASLSESYGEAFSSRVFDGPEQLQHTMLVFVDGENIAEQDGFATKLGNGDVEVIMLPMFGGG
ncbi:MAG: MoaD/ThiS family protein [Planctomycetota bacterium]|nr:MoaD/ThiS family protein [Planctomycetota bacterium]